MGNVRNSESGSLDVTVKTKQSWTETVSAAQEEGLRMAKQIRNEGRQSVVEPLGPREAVAAGADGYLQKFTGTEQLLAMVRDVAGGEYRMPRDVMRRVFRRLRHMPEEIDSPRRIRLTEREKEILTLILLQANSTSPRIFSYAHAHCTFALV